jgi:hypothetical protein
MAVKAIKRAASREILKFFIVTPELKLGCKSELISKKSALLARSNDWEFKHRIVNLAFEL